MTKNYRHQKIGQDWENTNYRVWQVDLVFPGLRNRNNVT